MKVIVFGDKLFSFDMAWGFRELGHDARIIAPGTVEELDKALSDHNPDLFITLGSPAYFKPALLRRLGDRAASPMKCIHWDTDGITWMGIEMNHIGLQKPDMVFTVCPEMLELLRGRGIPAELLFYASSPVFCHPGPAAAEFEGQIAFVGAAYPEVLQKFPNHYRRLSMDVLFKPLLNNGYRIDLYGDSRHKQVIKALYDFDMPDAWVHSYCPHESIFGIYSGCSINLVTQNHENTLTKRVFEILGAGGFALSYGNTAIRELFAPGKDLEVSSSPGQTLELVEYYKNRPEEYYKIRENAAISAQRHTYRERAEFILNKLAQD
jgi:spore maturation protein CgeB